MIGGSGVASGSGGPGVVEYPVLDFERRPRAVLAADIVGYTRLMELAELETHRRCRLLRVGVIDPVIIAHRGEIVKNTGDGYVAVFETPLDAIRCATELQQEVRVQEAGKPSERRIEFRMGSTGIPSFSISMMYMDMASIPPFAYSRSHQPGASWFPPHYAMRSATHQVSASKISVNFA